MRLFSSATDIASTEVPAVVQDDAKRSLLDLLATCATGDGRELWDEGTADPVEATMRNAFRSHVIDFDPVHPRTHGHPAAMLFPALLPYYLSGNCSGSDLVTAYAVGHEVMSVFGDIAGTALRAARQHPTCVLGAIAVSAAVGRVLGLGANELAQAGYLAAATTTGHSASFGSAAKPYQLAVAARNGHLAAVTVGAKDFRLAEPTAGILRVLRDTVLFAGDLETNGIAPFGDPWRVATTPTFHKLLPICGYLITTVLGFEKRLRDKALALPEVTSLDIYVPWSVATVSRPGMPGDVDEARFALGFLLAVALAHPVADFAASFAALRADQNLARIAAAATITHDPAGDADGLSRLVVHLRGADPVRLAVPVNGAGLPLDGEQVVQAKWRRYAEPRLSPGAGAQLATATAVIETVEGPVWRRLLNGLGVPV